MKISKEISGVLLFKMVFLLGLWWLCFSHPIQDHLTAQAMQQHLLSKGETYDR